ncbi:MAG: hypothetical protein H6665_00085 [Ardenticatenaceae bacterium]|nr:hypothetical protein [Ardenticatenaceae bacterium]
MLQTTLTGRPPGTEVSGQSDENVAQQVGYDQRRFLPFFTGRGTGSGDDVLFIQVSSLIYQGVHFGSQ